MEATSATQSSTTTPAVAPATTGSQNASTTAPQLDAEFEQTLTAMLRADASGEVNEEELFAALIHERLIKLKDAETSKKYQEQLTEAKKEFTTDEGYVYLEKSANLALDNLIEQGLITKAEGEKVRAEAFAAAQLDDNLVKLFDGLGSTDDPTRAVMEMEAALLRAQLKIESFDSESEVAPEAPYGDTEIKGENTPAVSNGDAALATHAEESYLVHEGPEEEEEEEESSAPESVRRTALPTDATPVGTVSGATRIKRLKNVLDTAVDGIDTGFLFRPESKLDKNLVVLLPANLRDQVAAVIIKDSQGNILETGQSVGCNDEEGSGEREHIRFSKRGRDYPEDIAVEAQLKNNRTRRWKIKNPAKEHD